MQDGQDDGGVHTLAAAAQGREGPRDEGSSEPALAKPDGGVHAGAIHLKDPAATAVRRKLYVSDKVRCGAYIKTTNDMHDTRDQKLLRMRSCLGGLETMMQRNLKVHPSPNVDMRLRDRPLSSYLRGGSSARVTPRAQQLEPLVSVKGSENFKQRYDMNKAERNAGGGSLYFNMMRGFYRLAKGVALRPSSPLLGVGGDIGKLLNAVPQEQLLPGKSWSDTKKGKNMYTTASSPGPSRALALRSVGPKDLTFALELENGSDEKDWWRSPADLLDVNAQTIRLLPRHFMFHGNWERTVVTLCNLHFLVQKMLLFGFEDTIKDVKDACAGLDAECKKFPDMKSWQEIYGAWRAQCNEYQTFLAAHATEIIQDVGIVFSKALEGDWGVCSQDAEYALAQVLKSVRHLVEVSATDQAEYTSQDIIKVQKVSDHVRLACLHGLHKCDESGETWQSLVTECLKKTTSVGWLPKIKRLDHNGTLSRPGSDGSLSRLTNEGIADTRRLHASLTQLLRSGLRMTTSIATTTITGRSEPRWYSTHIHDTYLTNDVARLIRAIDSVREGVNNLSTVYRPVKQVGLYLSTMGSMTVERELLTQIVLPAVAKYLMRFGVSFTWTDLRSAGPEQEFTKNCVTDAVRAMQSCRCTGGKAFAMFLTAEENMLLSKKVYKRPMPKVKEAKKQTQVDKANAFVYRLQTYFRERFDSIFDAWTYFDVNGDWNVSTQEFLLEYKKLKIPISAREVLNTIDKDGYGDVDVHEFVGALAWHDLPGDGSRSAIDKAVAHCAMRRRAVLKEIHARLSTFSEVKDDTEEVLESLNNHRTNLRPAKKAARQGGITSPKYLRTNSTNRSYTGQSILTQASKKSVITAIPQEIVQDSVLGPEILEEAAAEPGLDWVAESDFINSRLQRLEMHHALVQKSDEFEVIVFERTLPVAATLSRSASTTSSLGRLNSTSSSVESVSMPHMTKPPLMSLNDEILNKLEQIGRLQQYSLRNTGSDMGSFALKVAFSIIDVIALSLHAQASKGSADSKPAMETIYSGIETEEFRDGAAADSIQTATADEFLWQQEKIFQSAVLQRLQEEVLATEAKVDKVTEIWKQGTGGDLSVREIELGAFSRQECVRQLADWALHGENIFEEHISSLATTGSSSSRGLLEVAVMRGEPGCGLSSVCAMLVDHIDKNRTVASGKEDAKPPANNDVSVLHYFSQPHRNVLGADTYLISEVRCKPPFASNCQVGLSDLPSVLVEEAKLAGKMLLVVIDGLSQPDVASLLGGCEHTKIAESHETQTLFGLKLIVTCPDPNLSAEDASQRGWGLPPVVRDIVSRERISRLHIVRPFEGLSERERCALLHSKLGRLSSELSAPQALHVCRLEDARLPEFICVAAAHLKELSSLIPIDEAVFALERTLDHLYEFNILAYLEHIHGCQTVKNAAQVLLQTRVDYLGIMQLRALIPSRKFPRVMDPETAHNLMSRLCCYCHSSPEVPGSTGVLLKSPYFRRVLAFKYKLKHFLDEHENSRLEIRPKGFRVKADKSVSTTEFTRSSITLTSVGSKEVEMANDGNECDMDAIRSGMQTIILQKLLSQTQMRKNSKPVFLPLEEKLRSEGDEHETADEDVPPQRLLIREDTVDRSLKDVEEEPQTPSAQPGGQEGGVSSDDVARQPLSSRSKPRFSQVDAPLIDWSLYTPETFAGEEHRETKTRPEEMSTISMLRAIDSEDLDPAEWNEIKQQFSNSECDICSLRLERRPSEVQRYREMNAAETAAAWLEVQRQAWQHHPEEEKCAPITHGACLEKRHMWQPFQAPKMLQELDELIEAAMSKEKSTDNPVPELMIMQHRAMILEMKEKKENLLEMWTGAKMNLIWKAVSVCNMDVSCRMPKAPPGVYAACWYLKFSAGISDFPDIHASLSFSPADNQPVPAAGPAVQRVLTRQQQDVVKTGKWCKVVVCEKVYISKMCDVMAGLRCEGKWLSGLLIDCFALVPVRPEPDAETIADQESNSAAGDKK